MRRRILGALVVWVIFAMILAVALQFRPVRVFLIGNLKKVHNYQKDISISVEQAKTMPGNYKSVDKTIQEVVKKAYGK